MSLFNYSQTYTDALGRPITNANVAILTQSAIGTPATGVSTYPGSPLASIYQDAAGTIPLSNPTSPNGTGTVTFYVAQGTYTVQVYGPSLTHPNVKQDISIGTDGTTDPFMWRGAYSASATYQENDIVSYNGSSFISIATSTNQTPTSGSYWQILAQAGTGGSTGTSGATGAQGLVGPAGATGPAGSSGATGQGFDFRGAYSSSTTYAVYDCVSYDGSSYLCIGAGSNNEPDTSPTFWTLMVTVGSTGATGATGPSGPAAVWGSITGTLSSQTDLETALTAATTTAQLYSSNADNITSGTVASACLPLPTTTTLGGVEAITAVAHEWITSITTSGVPILAQPAATDISGLGALATQSSVTAAQLPNPTASSLGGVESFAPITNEFITSISTAGVVSAAQPSFSNLSGSATLGQLPTIPTTQISGLGALATQSSVTAAQLPNPTTSTLGGVEAIVAVSHEWINSISTSGVPSLSQPAFTDISGTIATGQVPTLNQSTTGTSSNITGTLAIANGGTGATTLLAAGIPIIVAKADATVQAANISATTLYAVPSAGAGMYEVCAYNVVTRAATTSCTVPAISIGWTDNDSNTNTGEWAVGQTTTNTLGSIGTGNPIIINVKASTNIQYNTTGYASSGATAMQYAIHIKLKYLGN